MQEVQEVVRKKMRTRRAIILLGVSMALLFLASALLPTEPSAQTTSPEGKIVYVKLGDIWMMDADGTNQTNLTNTPDTNEAQPAWSSDGTRIAFTSDQDEVPPFTDIWVMNSDGSNQTNLTPTDDPGTPTEETDNFHEYQPSWAPSGAQLAFVREIPGEIISEQSDIFVMDANGQTPATKLTQTDENESAPAWSPDGTKIAFAGVRNQGWEIVTMDPNGQNEAILTGDSFDGEDRGPDWSPDSTMVVFQKQCQGVCSDAWEIWGVNRDGSGDTNLTPNDLSEEDRLVTDHTGPSWSPDGSEITFTRTPPSVEGGQSDIYAMAAPTTLPPPSETASVTTNQHSGVMGLAASDVLVRAASAQTSSETAVRRLTTDGRSTEPDWTDTPADTPADTQAPRVSSTFPAAGATGIGPGVNVKATFSEAMRATSINTNTVKLFRAGTTTPIVAVVSYDTQTKTATLNPNANLRLGTKYKAVVTTWTRDLAGNRLDQNRSLSGLQQKAWFFTVRN